MGPAQPEMSSFTISSNGKNSLSWPILNEGGTNWVLYKQRMYTSLLGQPGFRKHLTGRAKPPPAIDVSKAKPDEIDDYEDKMDEYLQKEGAIQSIILASIPANLQARLAGTLTAKELWETLCANYDNQSVLVQSDYLNILLDIKCPEGGDAIKTIDEIYQAINDYTSAGGKIADDLAVAVMIKAMPPEYTPNNSLVISSRRSS